MIAQLHAHHATGCPPAEPAPADAPRPALTDKQQTVLEAIARYIREQHKPPTFRSLMALTEFRSTSHMHYYLEALEQKGYIVRDPREWRGIRLTGEGAPFPTCPHCGQEVAS